MKSLKFKFQSSNGITFLRVFIYLFIYYIFHLKLTNGR